MASLTDLGIGLSFVFGFIFLVIVAEIFHLLMKSRNTSREKKENSNLFCCKNPNSVEVENPQQISNSVKNPDPNDPEPDLELGPPKDLIPKGFVEEESFESELKRIHNLYGPPRFLFTIKEETREDLESDDGKSRGGERSRKGSRTRSLSDLVFAIDTPISLTPLASPKGGFQLESYEIQGFNPLFESVSVAETEMLKSSSPPPTFKFLRDAEEKFVKKLREEAERKAMEEREEGSFIRIIVEKNRETEQHQ